MAELYGGTLADVLRLVVPPRHAGAETEPPRQALIGPSAPPAAEPWGGYAGGAEYLEALVRGESPRAVWTVLPNTDPAAAPNGGEGFAKNLSGGVECNAGIALDIHNVCDLHLGIVLQSVAVATQAVL